jgi:TRAP-type mannitol/chloroaromatic compound transport system permease large subunit
MTPPAIGEFLGVAMFVGVVGLLMFGYPVAFTLGGAAVLFALAGHLAGAFDLNLLGGVPSRYFGVMTNEVLVAVPLFVFMGVMLERSRIAEQLLDTMGRLFGGLRGGLGISVVLVGTLLAASTGIVGATVVTMGLLSLPAMLRAGYDPRLASGLVCASGTLGQIIPPSTVLIFVAAILQGANTEAQFAKGNFAPDPVSVGDLFAGAFIPGLALSAGYIVWILIKAVIAPKSCPAAKAGVAGNLGRDVVVALVPPLFLIVAVLGAILAGVATPTESASVGAVGAIWLTLVKLIGEEFAGRFGPGLEQRASFVFWLAFLGFLLAVGLALAAWGGGAFVDYYARFLLLFLVALLAAAAAAVLAHGGMREKFLAMLRAVMGATMEITSMVFVILLGASLFALVFRGLGGEHVVERFLHAMPGGAGGALFVVMLIMFVLGFFLDTFEIIFIVVPIAGPILLQLGIDPILLGVMIGVNLQTSFLTPPFGFALFYLRGIAGNLVTTQQIYRGIMPFVAIQVLAMALLWQFPALATWLPDRIYRSETAAAPIDAPGASDDVPFGAPDDPAEADAPR